MARKSSADSLSHNILLVDFESISSLEHPSVLAMFRSLEASGLKRFIGGATTIYEDAVREFFKNVKMVSGKIQSSVKGSDVLISETIFSLLFEPPSKGLVSFGDVPVSSIAEMQSTFSADDFPVAIHGKKK